MVENKTPKAPREFVYCPRCRAKSKKLSSCDKMQTRVCQNGHTFEYDKRYLPANKFSSFAVRVYTPCFCFCCPDNVGCQCDPSTDIVYSDFPTEEKAIEKDWEIRFAGRGGRWIDVIGIGPRGTQKVIYTSSG